jgi:hypothetical protein
LEVLEQRVREDAKKEVREEANMLRRAMSMVN